MKTRRNCRENTNKTQSGITLIALVVTIVVLLILAGVAIAMLTGENSIIRKAIQAKEATSEAEALERVQLEVLGSFDRRTGAFDSEEFRQNIKDNLGVQEHQVQEQEDGTLDFPLGDYDIEVDPSGNVEALKNGEVPTPPQLEEGDITFTVDPSKLTNKEVKVSIKANIKTMRLTLQYATENPDEEDSWQTYTGPVTFKDNGPIYARLVNENGEKSNYTTGNISNIDRDVPTITSFTANQETATSSTVEVTVVASDTRGLATQNTYKFFAKEEGPATISLEDEAIAEGYKLNGTSTEGTYTYKGLTQGKSYTLKVIVTDEAGNTAEETATVNTTTVPSLEEPSPDPSLPHTPKLTFNYEPSTWNNKASATVTLQLSEELQSAGYKLQYSLDNDQWNAYQPAGFTISENQAVYARLIDDNNQTGGVATSTYTFFDRKAPNLLLKAGEKTQNEITLNVTATDTPSGLAEENPISYYIIEGRVTDLETAQSKKGEAKESSENKTYTYTELKPGTVYTLLVEVTDKAGNKTAKTLAVSTENLPGTTKPTTEGKDTDSDGKIDSWDTNGDGQIDAKDTDGDGNADEWLKDPTNPNSGWTDKKDQNPQPKDTNKDGLPDTWVDPKTGETVAEDTDGDGNADKFKDPATGEMKDAKDLNPMPQDTNGDGKPDTWVDPETGEEKAKDTDNDGKADQFVDENGNLTDKDEDGKTLKDTDGDGVPDARVDEEGNVENKQDPKDPESPWVPDERGKDTDGDGVVDQFDPEKYPEGTKKVWDTDGDGEDDAADTDGDGNADQWKKEDGSWSDKDEQDHKQWDTNGDGVPDAKDTTEDDNADEWLKDPTNPNSGWTDKKDQNPQPKDTDGDGLPDQWVDPDQGDKVVAKDTKDPKDGNASEFVDPKTGEFPESEKYPKPVDTNGDGLPDQWVDEDGNIVAKDTSDPKDGKADQFVDPATGKMPEEGEEETYPKAEDTNGDGLPDTWKDEDGNIVAKDDKEEPDGKPNKFVDPTDPEGPNKDGSNLTDTDEEGNKYQDNDGDGIPDVKVDPDSGDIKEVVDPETGEWKDPEEVPGKPKDTDKDGIIDTWDYNDDSKPDAWDKKEPKTGKPDTWDTDGDEKPDAWDTNNDGIADAWDTDGDEKPDVWDTDFDGIPDAFDTTEPKDGSADEWEYPAEEGTITFTYQPETWTNTPVTVTMKSDYTAQGYTIEYSKDYDPLRRTGEWTASETATLEQNGTIYAHLKKDDTEEIGGIVKGEVNYIDLNGPTVSVNVTGSSTNSATLNATASDRESGLAEKPYTYYLIDGEVTDLEQVKAQKGSAKEGPTSEASYKYTGLEQGGKYTLVVEVKDKAGNVTTESTTHEVGKIPGIDKEGDITFNYSKDTWNNDPSVHVTISTGENVDTKNYDLQYQTPEEENKEWQNYTQAGFDITKNGSIYARLKEKDGDQSGATATGTYSKFDRDDPTVSLEVDERTTTSIQVTATGSDGEGSGIKKYEFYEGANLKDTQETSDASATYTFDSLTPGEAYSLKVVITDNVERTGEATANADETKTIPDPNQAGAINFEYTPTDGNWTNDKVNVKATSKYTSEGYKIEYSTKEPESWQEYTADGFNVEEENGKFKVRFKQEAGELTSPEFEKTITWIDKTDPELSIKDEPQVSTNSIAVEVTASDELSQLKAGTPISYYLIEGEVADADQIQAKKGEAKESSTATSYTYTGLTQGQKYTVVIEATDNANNTATVSRVLTTGQVPGLDQLGDLTVTYSNTEWNNQESVHVTLAPKTQVNAAFKLEYKVEYTSPRPETDTNVPWTEYGDGFDITNNATITARITEKEGTQSGATATSTYSKFDREEPELSEISVTDTTTNSISVKVTATDKPDQGASGLLEENAYTYIIDQTANVGKEPSETQQSVSSNDPTHTFTGLTHGTDYTIKVMVADKAQNIAQQEKTQTTEKIPDLSQDGAITFDVTPSGWTNKEQATVKLNTASPVDETKFKLQYQTPNEENTGWQDYDKETGFTIKNNGPIHARLIEKEGEQTGTTATYNYNFFDRKLPEITIETEEPTVEDVKVNITDSKDEESEPGKNDASGLLDENKYTYYIQEVGGSSREIAAHIGNETSFTYGSLLQGKQYKVRVEVKDKAGNIGTSTTETITAKTIPDLNEADALEATYVPASWTNAESVNVTLTSKYTEEGYKLQYSTDYYTKTGDAQEINPSATWQDYEADGFTITDNQKYAARLKLESKYGQAAQYGKVKEEQVTWIDRVEPVLSIVGEPEKTTNSITVNVTASDELSDLKDSNPITYYLLDGSVTDPEQIKTKKAEAEKQEATSETTHQFTGLKQDTTYTVVVDAEDKAGNIATQSKVVTTVKVPDLNYGTDITYTYSSETWTNTPPVTVTLNPQNNIDEGFTLQYGTSTTAEEPKDWKDYNSSPFEQSENCTIYTRLKETDGEQVGKSAQSEMKLIDTENPTGTLKVSSYSTNSLSVEVENPEDTLSGLHDKEAYQYSLYEGSGTEGPATQTKPASTEKTASFTGLTQGKEYTVKVVIKDNAGNTHEATASETLDKVPDLAQGDITFDYDTKTWTNKESVKVTLTTEDTVDLDTYKLQYSTDYDPALQTGQWHDYPEGETGFTITENGTIYARLIEKDGTQTGGTATGTYTWFDRKAPTAELKVTGTTSTNTINVSAEGTIDEVGELTETPYVFSIYEGATAEGVAAKETKTAQATQTAEFNSLKAGTTYTVKVEVTDKATNTGSKTVTQATVTIPDLSQPGTITFTYEPTGNPAENNWSTTDVKVTATPNYLDNSFYKLQMKTDSKTSWTDYTSAGYMVETNEKVYAQLVEKNGGTQTSAGQAQGEVTWIDKDAPSVDPLTDSNLTADKETIDVTDLGAIDTISGVKSFAYFIKEGSGDYGAAIQTNEKNQTGSQSKVTDSFQYTSAKGGVKPSTTYTVKVVVKDNAGKETSVEKEITTQSAGKAPSEMTGNVGKYVKYEPSGGSTTYSSTQAHNGNTDATINRETLNWRILSVSGNTVTIISDATSGTVTYKGAEGYNNAVKDLNDMCQTLYSHGTTYARSVNLDDFTNSQWKSSFSQASGSQTPSNKTYPTIYQYESNGSLGQSVQTQWYSGTYTGSTAKNTYWSGSIPSDSPLYNSNYYWLSSRSVGVLSTYAYFSLQYAGTSLNNYTLFRSNGNPLSYDYRVRAVVSLPSSVTFGTETGDQSSPITINW